MFKKPFDEAGNEHQEAHWTYANFVIFFAVFFSFGAWIIEAIAAFFACDVQADLEAENINACAERIKHHMTKFAEKCRRMERAVTKLPVIPEESEEDSGDAPAVLEINETQTVGTIELVED